MTAPEAYIKYDPAIFSPDGDVADASVRQFLSDFMGYFHVHLTRVLSVLPRSAALSSNAGRARRLAEPDEARHRSHP